MSLETLRADLATHGPEAARHTGEGVALALLGRQRDGGIGPVDEAEPAAAVAVNREFLLQAIDAIEDGQLVLDLDGPIAPLVIRSAAGHGDLVMVMPVRREA